MKQIDPTQYIYVPLRADLYAELIKRSGRSDVHVYVENQVEGFLDSTEGDPMLWSEDYITKHVEAEDAKFVVKFGNPNRGYQWQNVYLPNGTQIRMTYRGQATYGEVKNEKLFLGNDSLSPSEFARRVANNTSRNAWRDIYIKFPGEGGWKFADDLRRQNK